MKYTYCKTKFCASSWLINEINLQIMFGTAAYEYILQQLQHEKLSTGYRYVHKMTFGKLQRATAYSVVLKYS